MNTDSSHIRCRFAWGRTTSQLPQRTKQVCPLLFGFMSYGSVSYTHLDVYKRQVAAGINAGASQAISAASNMAKSALAAAKNALDIHSPSKAFRWIGEKSVDGLVLGLNDKAKKAQAAAGKLADVVLKETSKLYDKIAEIEAAAQKRADEKELADYEKSLAEKYERLEEAEVDERQDILDEIAELKEDWNEKQLKKQEEVQKEELQSAIDALEEMEDEYQSALDDLKSDRDSLASKLSGDNLFEKDYKGETRLLNLDKDIQEDVYKRQPYAHYLWEGIVYVDPQTGAAGFLLPDGTWRSRAGITKVKSGKSLVFTRASAKPHWIEPAKAEFMSRWEEAYKKSFK